MRSPALSLVEPPLITVREAAELLHVHPNTIRRWEAQGVLQAWRVGPRRDRRFVRSEVKRLLEDDLVPGERNGAG